MRIILVGYGVVGKGVTTILAQRYAEKVKDYGFNPKIVAIADVDGAVINPRGFSPEKLEAIKQKGYPVSADPEFGHPKMPALEVIESVEAEVVVEVTPVNIKNGEPALSHITKAFKTGKHVVTTNKGPLALAMPALTELAEYNNVFLRFSGTVGGGTPMLEFAKRCLSRRQNPCHTRHTKRHNQLHPNRNVPKPCQLPRRPKQRAETWLR